MKLFVKHLHYLETHALNIHLPLQDYHEGGGKLAQTSEQRII